MTMNLKRTRAQSKSESPRIDSDGTPTSRRSNSPRTPTAARKKSSESAERKAKRTRTGCLTCRERHLKCDEALGRCLNCRKSDRVCRRGIRLNFIDIQTVAPPHVITRPNGTKVTFRDDSRFIASEYVGGFEKYPPVQPESPMLERRQLQHDALNMMGPDQLASLFHSVAQSFDTPGFDSHTGATEFLFGPDAWHEHLMPGDELLPHGVSNFARKLATKQYADLSVEEPEHIRFLQAFANDVAPRLDCVDPAKYFSEVLPLHALDEPMLLKALLACGARHESRHDSTQVMKATAYYDAATEDLLLTIQDPNRDSVLCAIVSLVLGIYETMLPEDTSTKNHIAGARAFIRECKWNAKTSSIGGTCFWISVTTELLSCLQHTWSLSWDPDTWGVDIDMNHAHPHWKNDDIWLHRIMYICGKASNIRVKYQMAQNSGSTNSELGRDSDLQEWNHCRSLLEQWKNCSPRSMRPVCRAPPWLVGSESQFPKVWLLKRTAVTSQIFHHTASIILASSHPTTGPFSEEMKNTQLEHAQNLFGLVANSRDSNVASIMVPCLGIAASVLETQASQEEALKLIEGIGKCTPQSADIVKEDLSRRWNWLHPETLDPTRMHNDSSFAAQPPKSNPLSNASDFSMGHHPYQGFYVHANHHGLDSYQCDPYLV